MDRKKVLYIFDIRIELVQAQQGIKKLKKITLQKDAQIHKKKVPTTGHKLF